MTGTCRFVMGLHSHQPVGNFDHVVEDACRRSYLPLLKALDEHPAVKMSLHFSGALLEWMEAHHPESFDLLRGLVKRSQVELMGGAMQEPILVMLPERDRLGQMRRMSEYLETKFGVRPRGMWLPERVWEQNLVHTMAQCGFEYVCVDDSHFKFAGLAGEDLSGHFVTEDEGKTMSVFPMDETLRYYIPFRPVHETVDYLRRFIEADRDAVVTYADDGEKFGIWPGTHKLVYEEGWLKQFFDVLQQNADWIRVCTFAQALDEVPARGKVYLPDASYREMMTWALPAERQQVYEDLSQSLKEAGTYDRAKFFLKGGFWRSFRAKYPEANDMYSKMMLVSEKVAAMPVDSPGRDEALAALYRGQCNCAYWHGVFGGLYLPHLRHAIYRNLIHAENLADRTNGRKTWVGAAVQDFNFDRQDEVLLNSETLNLLITPHYGGHLVELDVRAKEVNITAGLSRREEAYHRLVRKYHGQNSEHVGSIHESVHFKAEGLDQMLFYDGFRRETLTDHILDATSTLEGLARCQYVECGDFVTGVYDFEIKHARNRQSVTLTRQGQVRLGGKSGKLRVTKNVELTAKSPTVNIGYALENTGTTPLDFFFAVEFSFSMLAGHAPDRYYYRGNPENGLGDLCTKLDLPLIDRFGLVDAWQGIDASLSFTLPAGIWTFPIETVSQSEGGFESVYQSSIIVPRWQVTLKPKQSWTVRIEHNLGQIGPGKE